MPASSIFFARLTKALEPLHPVSMVVANSMAKQPIDHWNKVKIRWLLRFERVKCVMTIL